jgi:outer membrane protein assembly factor BamB
MRAGCRASLVALALGASSLIAADWPQFRGPRGTGASEDRGLPLTWGPKENVLWKVKLPGPGASSPIVWGGRVFVTCYSGYGAGEKAGRLEDLRRHLLCFDRKTGARLWQRDVPARLPETAYEGFITEHGFAASTPAADRERVYVFFGRSGILAYDHDGKQLWHTLVGDGLNGWGSAASPILYRDLLLVNASVESSSLVALDRRTGKRVWRAKGLGDSWSSPVLVTTADGKDEVVQNTPDGLVAFNPTSGEQLWQCEGPGSGSATSTPVARAGIVYAMGGGVGGPGIMAVRAGGRGNVNATHVLWRRKAGAGICSPVLYGDYLYWVNGQAWCVRADTGEPVYHERLYRARSEYASPVAADGKVIAFTRRDGAYVLATGGKFAQLAHNDLGDKSVFNGSPAVSDGQLFVRSETYLYCIDKAAGPGD